MTIFLNVILQSYHKTNKDIVLSIYSMISVTEESSVSSRERDQWLKAGR